MAKRDTRKEAEELKKQLQQRHPDATIIIEKESGESQVSPYGLGHTYQEEDIIRYEGDFPVIGWTTYHILELATCHSCDAEIKSIAIGESGLCGKCQSTSLTNQSASSKPAYGDYEATGWMDK